MADERNDSDDAILDMIREARAAIRENGSFRARVLLDMLLIELETRRGEEAGDDGE